MAKVRAKNSSKAKSTKKFAQAGHLARTIKERRQRKQKKSQIENRQALKDRGKPRVSAKDAQGGKARDGAAGAALNGAEGGDDQDEDDDDGLEEGVDGDVAAGLDGEDLDDETLEALLGGAAAGGSDDEDEDDISNEEGQDDDLQGLEGEEERHKVSLQALKEKDPEFYKYLQENDPALLGFGDDDAAAADDDDDEDDGDELQATTKKGKKAKGKERSKAVVVNKELLAQWQKQMLKQRSLKALRKLLLAFRAAAVTDDEESSTSQNAASQQYTIPNAAMFSKVVTAALKYTPLVLNYHVPVKEQSNGKFKLPTQSKKYASAQRVVKSFYASLHALLSSLSSSSNIDLLHLAITESGRLAPYLVGNRKLSKEHLRYLISYWSSSPEDRVKLSAFLSMRTLALAGDAALSELVLKGTYLAIGQVAKNTTAFTLPSITLMKNSASSLFVPQGNSQAAATQAYQIAFSYIRQLAITLRNSMKATPNAGGKMKKEGAEPYRQVYNWQFVHSIDFWSIVLATACDRDKETEQAKESELRPLIYPLVQMTLGVIRLVPTSRYFPLRFQLVTSLLRIVQRTGVYVPIAPVLLEIFDSSEFTKNPKGSSLKPLDWSYYIRAPAAYPKTRVYVDALAEETCYLLLEFFASQSTSIAFPELSIPVVFTLRKHAKKTKNPKMGASIKALVERLESNARWIEEKRSSIDFSPQDRTQVDSFLSGKGEETTPLRTYLKLQRKVRDQRREVLEKSLAGDDELSAEEAEGDEDMEDDA